MLQVVLFKVFFALDFSWKSSFHSPHEEGQGLWRVCVLCCVFVCKGKDSKKIVQDTFWDMKMGLD
jgi:hypothetical protein